MRYLLLSLFVFATFGAAANTVHTKEIEAMLHKLRKDYQSHNDSLPYFLTVAENIILETKDYAALVEIYRLRGNYLFLAGNHSKAIETYIQGIKIGEQHKVSYELEIVYYEIAGVYSKNGDKKMAYAYIHKGLALGKQLNDTMGLADGHNRIGIMLDRDGKLDSSMYHYNISYALNKSINNYGAMSYSLENIATVLSQQNNFEQSIVYLKQALTIRKDIDDKYGVAIATINISESYMQSKQLDSAVFYGHKAELASTSIGFLDLTQYTYQHLCNLYKLKSDFNRALHYHELYTTMKDSVYNKEKSKQITEFTTKFETERKEQQIKVLNKQKTIQKLGLIATVLALLIMIAVLYVIYKNRKIKEEKLKTEAQFQLQLQEAEARNAMQNERLRISRELHDNIGAHLTFINATVDNIENDNSKLQQVKDLTNETIRELRKTVWLINKSSVKVEEFVVKLRDFLKNIPQLIVSSGIEDTNAMMKAELITELFRTTQESVNNALKYSGADNIKVEIHSSHTAIHITITDNGCGFDINEQSEQGFGLENMRHRMQSIGGNYSIISEKNKGTTVTLDASFS